MERVKRFERSTPTLARLCSTPELHPLARPPGPQVRAYMTEALLLCNREMTDDQNRHCEVEPERRKFG